MPPEARPPASQAPITKSLSFAQKQLLFEGFSKTGRPLEPAQVPSRKASVTGKPKPSVLPSSPVLGPRGSFTAKNPPATSTIPSSPPLEQSTVDQPVAIHIGTPSLTITPPLEDAKTVLAPQTPIPVEVVQPPFEIYCEDLKVEKSEFKIKPTGKKEQLCELWFANKGEDEIMVEAPHLETKSEDPVFSLESVSQMGPLPPNTVKMSTSHKFIIKCSTTKLDKTCEDVIVVPWTNKTHMTTQYYRLRVYANALTAAENLQYPSFPLRYIQDKWHLVANDVVNPEFKEHVEMTLGLHVSLAFLNLLYGIDHIPEWNEVKDGIEVGLIKDTNDCGNSSVSMGLAWIYFKTHPAEEYVAFLNCGTGGVKLQIYTRDETSANKYLVSIVKEDKPGKGAVANIIGIGDYRPQGKKQSLDDVKKELERVVLEPFASYKKRIHDQTPEEKKNINWTQKKPFAFVTGTIRSHWEKANDDMKQEMESKLIELFNSENESQNLAIPVSDLLCNESGRKNRPCYFVSTEDEGRMEFVGVRAMQKSVDRTLKKDDSAKVDPVAVLGIGTGASRLTILSSKTVGRLKKKEYVVIPHEAGMTNTIELLKLGRVLISDERIRKFVEACSLADRRGRIPMIALKSGALLRLWDDKFFNGLRERAALSKSPDVEYFKTRGNDGKSRQMILSTTTLSRFASDASKLEKASNDYLVAWKDGVQLGPGILGDVSVEFVKTLPPYDEQKSNTCYVGPKDSIVWEGLPAFVWWWPWKNKMDLANSDACKSPLLIRLPFALLKDFLPNAPTKKPVDTIVTRFERVLRDFLGHDASKPAISYECICKVYRLLYEVRERDMDEATKAQFDQDTEKMVNGAILFSSRAPKYDHVAQSQFRLSRGHVMDKLKETEKKARLTGWRGLSKETSEWVLPPTPFRPFCQDARSFSENRRKAWFLLDAFTRSLQAACDSKLLSAFSGINFVAGVKSEKGLLRKQEDDRKEPEDIYDYLRGTIYVGRGKESMMDQVIAILDAIQDHVAPLERIKWDHCDKDKGFIIVNVRFGLGAVSILCEVQIRLPSKKSSSAPPDDHLKHEALRTFGLFLNRSPGSTATFADAVAKFFSLPCKHPFEVFKRNESVTIQEVNGEVEVLRSTPTEVKVPPPTRTPTPVAITQEQQDQQWNSAIDHFTNVLREITKDQNDIVAAQSVKCPPFITAQDNFYIGVREGFQIVQRALGIEENKDDAEKKDTKEREKAAKERFIKKNGKFVYDAAVFAWLVQELEKLSKEKPIIDRIATSEDDIYAKLVEELGKSSNAQVMGIVSAWRFCCRNLFLYKLLKDDSISWFDLFQNNPEKAGTFGVLAALFRVGDQVYTKCVEDQQAQTKSAGVRRLPSVHIVGVLGQSASGSFTATEAAAVTKSVTDYNENRTRNKKIRGDVGTEMKA